ncbi:MAG: YrhA family protein [Lachnospiraceae bacterium]|nr:YrhA family protein [Lachnospiraceae bacterium]
MNQETITKILAKIRETNALIVQPAGENDLARCQVDLATIGVPLLPSDYMEFLKIANGVSWNDFQFFGTAPIMVKVDDCALASIFNKNEIMHTLSEKLEGFLVVGSFRNEIYVYNPRLETFDTLEAGTFRPLDSFDSFDEMLEESVGYYAFYDDEEEEDGNLQ